MESSLSPSESFLLMSTGLGRASVHNKLKLTTRTIHQPIMRTSVEQRYFCLLTAKQKESCFFTIVWLTMAITIAYSTIPFAHTYNLHCHRKSLWYVEDWVSFTVDHWQWSEFFQLQAKVATHEVLCVTHRRSLSLSSFVMSSKRHTASGS